MGRILLHASAVATQRDNVNRDCCVADEPSGYWCGRRRSFGASPPYAASGYRCVIREPSPMRPRLRVTADFALVRAIGGGHPRRKERHKRAETNAADALRAQGPGLPGPCGE